MAIIKRYRTLWGIEPGTGYSNWEKIFPELKAHGYAGVEIDISDHSDDNLRLVRGILDDVGLEATVLFHSSWPGYAGPRPRGLTPDVHIERYTQQLESAKLLRPVNINSQSGADYWTWDESVYFYKRTLEVDTKLGLEGKVTHETHRNRSLFTPYAADYVLQRVPNLRITADFSHWVVCCERLLTVNEEDIDILNRVIPKVYHIHARMGTTQSSQCPEPTHPVFTDVRESFDKMWVQMVKARAEREPDAVIRFVPEYGPYPYHPFGSAKSNGEVADSESLRLEKLFEEALRT